jgi:hypothetical protein
MARAQLHEIFELLTANVYYQPPNGLKMEYPCIAYHLDAENVQYADNGKYRFHDRYQVTVMDRDPDSVLRQMVSSLPLCSFDRGFAADNLNNFVFNLHF